MTANRSKRETGGTTDRRRFLRATGGAVAFGTLAGCVGGDGGGDEGPITLGSLQPLSGPFTPWGQAHSAGMEFAVQEINDDGGVMGRDLEIEEDDTGSDPGEADTIFRRMVEQGDAVAVTGPVSSDVGIATRETAEELETPLILHMAGSHRILPKDVRYCFRMGSHSAVTDMRSVLGMVEAQGFTEVGAIIADYEWGRSVETTIGELLPEGVNLSMEVAPLDEDNFSPFLRNFPEGIEVVLASGHPPGSISIHGQAIDLGLDHEYTVGAGFPPGVLAEGLGENAATFAHQHVSDPFGDNFVEVAERFADDRGERFDTHEAYGYSAVNVFAEAMEAAESTDPSDIADAMRENEFDVLLANPINYVEYGEMTDLVHMLSTIQPEAPEYYPEGGWRLEELYRSDPLPAFDPDEWEF
ncbi:ABC transporter substrate-binding protein [Halobacteriales archaeon QS_4_66_20]|nr:MAG: ABC transporter substrate-binding protein [Halobacteriales archaeon QS_4_66_20]